MSLYGDIISKTEAQTEIANEWSTKSSSIKLLQDHLQIKRTTQNLTKNNTRKIAATNVLQPRTLNESSFISEISNNFNTSKSSNLFSAEWDFIDEYDPRWPNDYEKIIKERREIQNKEFGESSKKRKNSSSSQVIATRSLGLDYGDEDDDEYEDERNEEKAKSRANASFAPPPTLLENVEKVSSPAGFGVSSVAAKIMAKMGYKEGSGLGKDEQGISKALQVEKTSKSGGKIIYENEINKKTEELSITEMLKNPSRVVLLRNMVGPGEVDDELEPETKEECSKYGEVISCTINEYQDYDSDEDAVRIFIEFVRVESAVKALIDLNGRYFGGRIVKASFYDVERYKNRDLR